MDAGASERVLSALAAFVIGSSHGPGLRGEARVMRPEVMMMNTTMGVILENTVNVLEGELVSRAAVVVYVERC